MRLFVGLLLFSQIISPGTNIDVGVDPKINPPEIKSSNSDDKKTLRFNEEHEFTILQFTDLHYGDKDFENTLSTLIQEKLISMVNPDLVVVTGDAVSGYAWDGKTPGYFKSRWEQFTAPYLKYQVKYAYIFGNHEAEADFNAKQIGELDKTHPFSLFNGDSSIDSEGYSNYVLPVLSSYEGMEANTSSALWMFDTRKTGCDGYDETYGCINKAQISWYKKESENLVSPDGDKISGLGFFHIPLPEFMNVWNTHLTYGDKKEKVACPTVNSGAFDVFRTTGNIKGLFCGHDHNNDYGGTYKGIELVYGRKSGVGSYGPNGMRGARVIKMKETLQEGKAAPVISFETYIVQENLTIVKQEEAHWQGYKEYQTKCGTAIAKILGLLSLLIIIL